MVKTHRAHSLTVSPGVTSHWLTTWRGNSLLDINSIFSTQLQQWKLVSAMMSFIKRSGDSKRNQWPAPKPSRLTGRWNKEQSNCNSEQAQAFDPGHNAGCGSRPLQKPTPSTVWGKNIFWNEQEANSLWEELKEWQPHHPKSGFSGKLNFLLKSWQSSSLSGRRKERLQNSTPSKMVKKSV